VALCQRVECFCRSDGDWLFVWGGDGEQRYDVEMGEREFE